MRHQPLFQPLHGWSESLLMAGSMMAQWEMKTGSGDLMSRLR
jgi:hypothetical protein